MGIIKGYRDEIRILNQIRKTSDNSGSIFLFNHFEFNQIVDLKYNFVKAK